MRIERLVQWTRDPDPDFLRELEIFNDSLIGPDLLVHWSPRPVYGDSTKPKRVTGQDARWEFWFTLQESQHRDATNKIYRYDIFHDGRWYRKLQSWALRDAMFFDVGYAPLEWNPLEFLREADTWRNRTFFEDKVLQPGIRADERQMAERKQVIRDVGRYYKDLDRTLVSPGGRHTGGWRHRNR